MILEALNSVKKLPDVTKRNMCAVGLTILRKMLATRVRLAGGATVLVTDRDRVVAQRTPPSAGRAAALADSQIAEAVRAGLLTPPVFGPDTPLPRGPSVAPAARVLDELADDRASR